MNLALVLFAAIAILILFFVLIGIAAIFGDRSDHDDDITL